MAGWAFAATVSGPIGSGTAIYTRVLAARLRNRSTCPPVSTMRCVPVKNGWHTEQISVFSSLRVDPVVNVFPHAQVTTASSEKVGGIWTVMVSPGRVVYRARATNQLAA